MIFQQFNLLNNKTVLENITLPLKLHKFESALDIEEVLSFVGLSGKKITTRDSCRAVRNSVSV